MRCLTGTTLRGGSGQERVRHLRSGTAAARVRIVAIVCACGLVVASGCGSTGRVAEREAAASDGCAAESGRSTAGPSDGLSAADAGDIGCAAPEDVGVEATGDLAREAAGDILRTADVEVWEVSASSPAGEAQCDNGIDDDLDGLTDCADPDCTFSVPCCDALGQFELVQTIATGPVLGQVMSRSGDFLYVLEEVPGRDMTSQRLTKYRRNAATGALQTAASAEFKQDAGWQFKALSILGMSADDRFLYVLGASPKPTYCKQQPHVVAVFGGPTESGGVALDNYGIFDPKPDWAAIDSEYTWCHDEPERRFFMSPDGISLYLVGGTGTYAWRVLGETGGLEFGGVTPGALMVAGHPSGMYLFSPDSAFLYHFELGTDGGQGAGYPGYWETFKADPSTGVLVEACEAQTDMPWPSDCTVSPDGRHMYVSQGTSGPWHLLCREAASGSLGGTGGPGSIGPTTAGGCACGGVGVFASSGTILYVARSAGDGSHWLTALGRTISSGELTLLYEKQVEASEFWGGHDWTMNRDALLESPDNLFLYLSTDQGLMVFFTGQCKTPCGATCVSQSCDCGSVCGMQCGQCPAGKVCADDCHCVEDSCESG